MKRHIWQLLIMLSVWGSGTAYGEEVPASPAISREVTDSMLVPFFVALRNGDVKSLKLYLAPEIYQRYRVLIEQNRDYPQFLRDFYRTSQMRVNSVSQDGNDVIADITIDIGDGGDNHMRLVAHRDTGGAGSGGVASRPRGPWKVVREETGGEKGE